MKSKSADKIKMPSIDELLGVSGEESATDIEISRIHSFANHPFKVLDDDKMDDLVESIKQNGVLTPVLVRPDKNNSYEMISGHRRMHAAIKAGLETIPAIVRDIEDDEAIVIMVDVLENNLFLPIAHIETGFFDGRDLYSKYLEVEQCMENDRTNQHMIIQMKDAKLEEERIIYALWKDKKFDQVAEKLVLYFNKTNSIQERQNLMIRLSYYLYIAMNEEKGEKQLIFKEFYDSFPKIKREFSEMEIAVRTTETLKKLTEKMEKMEKKILHPVIYNIQKDIRDNYSEVKLLKDYAKKYNINATYLSELFVKECGKTFSDIVTDIKMDKAKNMLNEPDARVYEVAVKLGYHDGRYFSQLFKRCTGMTPKEFQKRCDKYE